MLKTLKTLGLMTLVALGASNAEAQTGNLEFLDSVNGTNVTRPNLFYSLPGDVKGYTFIEFYDTSVDEEDQFFVKHNLNRDMITVGNVHLGPRSEIKDGDEFDMKAGVGIQASTKKEFGSTKVTAMVKALPFWMQNQEQLNADTVGYFVSSTTPTPFGDVSVGSFGEFQTGIWEDTKAKWGYGEAWAAISLDSLVDGLKVGLNTAIRADDGFDLEADHRILVQYNFK